MPRTENPKNGSPVSVRLPVMIKAWVDEQAKAEGISPSEFIRYCLMRERRR